MLHLICGRYLIQFPIKIIFLIMLYVKRMVYIENIAFFLHTMLLLSMQHMFVLGAPFNIMNVKDCERVKWSCQIGNAKIKIG